MPEEYQVPTKVSWEARYKDLKRNFEETVKGYTSDVKRLEKLNQGIVLGSLDRVREILKQPECYASNDSELEAIILTHLEYHARSRGLSAMTPWRMLRDRTTRGRMSSIHIPLNRNELNKFVSDFAVECDEETKQMAKQKLEEMEAYRLAGISHPDE